MDTTPNTQYVNARKARTEARATLDAALKAWEENEAIQWDIALREGKRLSDTVPMRAELRAECDKAREAFYVADRMVTDMLREAGL